MLPCGLTLDPKIVQLREGKEPLMVSQFMMELQVGGGGFGW